MSVTYDPSGTASNDETVASYSTINEEYDHFKMDDEDCKKTEEPKQSQNWKKKNKVKLPKWQR